MSGTVSDTGKYESLSPDKELHQRRLDRSGKLFKRSTDYRGQRVEGRQNASFNKTARVHLPVNGRERSFSALLLRDLCQCGACVDSSTRQKFFSTTDIPRGIRARTTAFTATSTSIKWLNDIPGFDESHTTEIESSVLQNIVSTGYVAPPYSPGRQTTWNANDVVGLDDLDYEAYMHDDFTLYRALRQLHSHGLLFLSNVPESEDSVSAIAERIGPLKNTFYGYTWDVRSVPQAKNVAYTSQDLGFHMDLLYMHQPPHLQFLHCMRSSAQGGASLFTDAYQSACDVFEIDRSSFNALSGLSTTFHYDHPDANLYKQKRPTFELKPLRVEGVLFEHVDQLVAACEGTHDFFGSDLQREFSILDYISAVSWSPPFQAPFSVHGFRSPDHPHPKRREQILNHYVDNWHAAATKFSELIHRPKVIHERLMKPGECVLFDNRRVLHARRAFEVGDLGKERWLRGAYLDKDPFMSKMQVLQRQFGNGGTG